MQEAPFTEREQALFNEISALYVPFYNLESKGDSHPSDHQDMADGIHKLQDILIKRAARRTWPGTLASFQKIDGRFVQANRSNDEEVNSKSP